MDDRKLDEVLDRAAATWRVPVDPPLDEIWKGVEAEAFGGGAARRRPGWSMVGIAAAAALIVGAIGGRFSARSIVPPVPTTMTGVPGIRASVRQLNDPDQRAMGELLGRTAVLLAALPGDTTESGLNPQISREGARLLTTTRLLLDSPAGADPRLRNLLQDLELVLAQVARLQPRERHDDMQFIQTALDEHDIVPRIRSAAADLSLTDF